MQGEDAAKDNEALYMQGFKDGALLMMEILANKRKLVWKLIPHQLFFV